jgi:hypothetical protein
MDRWANANSNERWKPSQALVPEYNVSFAIKPETSHRYHPIDFPLDPETLVPINAVCGL